MLARATFSYALLAAVLLAGCAAPVPPKPPVDTTPKLRPPVTQTRASFACHGALPNVHQQICSDDRLAELDRSVVLQQYQLQQELDTLGSILLAANHRQWLLSRAELCPISEGNARNEQAIACLSAMYRQRARMLDEWAASRVAGSGRNAWSSYAEYRLVDDRDTGSCTSLEQELNRDLQQNGIPSPARLTGVQMLAGTHAPDATVSLGNHQVKVELYNAGVYAGHQTRARGLTVNGQPLLDDATLAFWVAEQPNYGGRAHAASSQTGDYGAIDVFQRGGRNLVLVNETWGFHSPAARGESAYAGLYALNGSTLQRLCLYQSYLTPPRTNTLAGLTVYAQLQSELEEMVGSPLPSIAQHERRDSFQNWKETQWTLLNLPLLAVDSRAGREGALRQRHDQALEALFQWSERNLENKQAYRQLLPLLQPARQELRQLYSGQGLNGPDADGAADLLVHETLARAVESLAAPTQRVSLPLPAGADWQPRYAIAPAPGDLERGRQFATLHSVLLNNAPSHVVADFIRYETDTRGAQWGRGPDDNPATMAAVMRVDNLRLLLNAGMHVDQTNRWGKTALMTAAQHNQLDSLRLLLERGADVYAQTRIQSGVGVGGLERSQAEEGVQTALLLAARHAEAALLNELVQAGAARQVWDGYHHQVCQAMQANTLIAERERSALQQSLCNEYAPLAAVERRKIDVRAGNTLLYALDGVSYQINLQERRASILFGRTLQTSTARLEQRTRAMAVRVGTAAAHRNQLQLDGPLTLHIADLAGQTPEASQLFVSYPVTRHSALSGGYSLVDHPPAMVLSTMFDSAQNDPASTWRALHHAALEQGLQPANQGYVVMHTRGRRIAEYQLVVTDPATE